MSRNAHSTESHREPQTVGELLMEQRLLTEERFRSAQETARRRMVSTEDILREEGLVTDALLREALMEHYRVPAMGQRSLFPQTGMATIIGDFLRALKERQLKADFLRTSHRTEMERLREERARRASILKRWRVPGRRRERIERVVMRREERHRKAEMKRRKREELRTLEEERRKKEEAAKERKRTAALEKRRRKEEEGKRKAEERRREREAEKQRRREERREERRRKAQERERKRAEKRAAREAAKKQRVDDRQRRRDEKRSARESAKKAKEEMKASRRRRTYQPEERGETRAPLPITVQGIVTTQQVPTAAAPVVVAAPTVVRQVLPPTTEEQSAVVALREEITSLKEENRNLRDTLESAGKERLPVRQAGTVIVEKEMEVPAQGRGMTSVETDGAALADLQRKYEDKLRMQQAKFDVTLEEERKKLADAQRDATVNTAGDGGETAVERERLEAQQKELEREKLRLRAERETFEGERRSAAPAPPAPAATEGGMPSAGDREARLQEMRKEYEEELRKQKAKFDVEREELIGEAAKAGAGVSGGVELTRIRGEAKEEAETALRRERAQWEIEKERIRQQAIAEAESEFLAKMKEGGGLFGGKQKSALTGEIAKWKEKAGKLEKERRELEQQKALHEEQVRLREKERQMEQEKLRLEREKITKEKQSLATEEAHEETMEEGREALRKERETFEITKETKMREQRERKKILKKTKKEKTGFFGGKKKKDEEAPETASPGEAPDSEQTAIDLGKILLAQNYIEEGELESARAKARERHVSLESVLREEGLVTKELAQNAIAEHYRMPFVDLSAQPPDTEVVEMLPEDIATYLRAIAIEKKDDGSLVVATSDPSQGDMIKEEVKKALPGVPEVTLVYTSKDAIESALSFYRKALNTRFSRIIGEHKKIAPEIIEEIFADAVQLGASDIHFEPQEKIIIVRFRVDGVMHEAGRLPREYYEGIVNRVKIAGNMRIDEHFAAQDGAIRWKSGDRAMDVRVSIVPIVDGEKVVMRLLSEYVRTLTLRDLGFAARHLDTLVKTAHKPFGMILTTGPTGSGKSTTLYGLMKIRNSPDVNISTIEDPVEYKIPGINHIQVNPKSNLTFERGLRALVRQDPDIILVGEIRDDITAQISVNAALTGHLLFSTLHANDAATAIPRLLEMGIEPYLLGSTLELIIAQRLMRRICTNCRYSYTVSPAEAGQLFTNAERYFTEEREMVTLYRGKGCGVCGETGYKGRVGVYEILPVTTEIEEAVVARRTSGDINIIARSQGMLTLFEDGLEKALYGLSTIEELLRIAAPPDALETSTVPEISSST